MKNIFIFSIFILLSFSLHSREIPPQYNYLYEFSCLGHWWVGIRLTNKFIHHPDCPCIESKKMKSKSEKEKKENINEKINIDSLYDNGIILASSEAAKYNYCRP